ncbi:MAG: hypothetical protein QXR54_01670 [Nanopusillaceae archaeon]|nr:hypothetical protein [Candidatus Aenigmarchaeota archaeon]
MIIASKILTDVSALILSRELHEKRIEKREYLDKLNELLEKILKEENLIQSLDKYLLEYLTILVSLAMEENLLIINVSKEDLEKYEEFVKDIQNELEKRIFEIIYYFDTFRIYVIKNKGVSGLIDLLQNIDFIFLSINVLKLSLLSLLYEKDKEKVLKYENYINEMIEVCKKLLYELEDRMETEALMKLSEEYLKEFL